MEVEVFSSRDEQEEKKSSGMLLSETSKPRGFVKLILSFS